MKTLEKEQIVESFDEHNEYFTKIHDSGGWGPNPSGGGSTLENTVEYREFLVDFISKNNITRVHDFGCGDWNFSKLIDWSNTKYTGIDVVKSIIEDNRKYSDENVKFIYLKDAKKFYKTKGELLIIKDVLQHWTNEEITSFLDQVVNNFKFILITNSSPQQEDWQDTPERNRPLSCNYYPLKKYNIQHLFNFGEKEVSLIEK